jgi:hypothetical protein
MCWARSEFLLRLSRAAFMLDFLLIASWLVVQRGFCIGGREGRWREAEGE